MDTKEPEVLSDNDIGERPVREQLKKTTIDGLSRPSTDDGTHTQPQQPAEDQPMHSPSKTNGAESENGSEEGRGRSIKKKRSFDDLERGDDTQDGEKGEAVTRTELNGSMHKRKRSRDIQAGDMSGSTELSRPPPTERLSEGNEATSPGSADDAGVEQKEDMEESTRRKRSREDAERSAASGTSAEAIEKEAGSDIRESKETSSETAKTVEKTEATKIPATSGFANSSSVSPFAALAASKSPEPSSSTPDKTEKPAETTSSSAFASSGLAAFASSEKSPFGALGASSGSSGFGALGGSEKPKLTSFASGSAGGFGALGGSDKPKLSSFASGATGGTGGFGTSAFAKAGGSGFGSTLGGGSAFGGAKSGGLSTFASPSGPAVLGGGKPAKPFGAPVRGDESDNEGDDEDASQEVTDPNDPDHRDERFYQQDIETGEEHEDTIFATRSKLLCFDGKEWKERGVGVFKLNVTPAPEDQPESKQTARFIMRAEGVLRVILNMPVSKELPIAGPQGGEPTGKSLSFPSLEGPKPLPILLRISDPEKVKDLYQKVKDLQKDM